MDAHAFTAGDTIVMPASHGPLDRGPGQALLAHELVHVGQQRRMGSSLPPEHSSAGQQLEREAQSAQASVTQASQRTHAAADMPVARAGVRHSANDAPASHTSEVHQATQLALAAGPRAEGSGNGLEIPATPAAGVPPGPQPAAVGAAAGTGLSAGSAGAATPHDDEEFEELARRLYERLRLRLKRELLLDRERSGSLADSR